MNVSIADPGGEDDPACIPKMANLNSQVCLTYVTFAASPPALLWPLITTNLSHSHQHVASAFSQCKHGNLGLKHCYTEKQLRTFIKRLLMD